MHTRNSFYQEYSVSLLERFFVLFLGYDSMMYMIYHAHFLHAFLALLEQPQSDGNLMKTQNDLFITEGLFKAVTMTYIH